MWTNCFAIVFEFITSDLARARGGPGGNRAPHHGAGGLIWSEKSQRDFRFGDGALDLHWRGWFWISVLGKGMDTARRCDPGGGGWGLAPPPSAERRRKE